jgi:hypothetical protein
MEMDRSTLKGKDKEYAAYIDRHIASVNSVWKEFRENKKTEVIMADGLFYSLLSEKIRVHDKSKFSRKEFFGYRQWFYPEEGESKSESIFLHAWNCHQKSNDHHWQYWVMPQNGEMVALEMPTGCAFEMMIDWTAMSVIFGNKPSDWYSENKEKMVLHEGTRNFVEGWLELFDEIYIQMTLC